MLFSTKQRARFKKNFRLKKEDDFRSVISEKKRKKIKFKETEKRNKERNIWYLNSLTAATKIFAGKSQKRDHSSPTVLRFS